ncbi:Nramp family divalent metal transporter [Prauserella cavernicola]|uniref:Nramp family divalent metal transporter n=1 Tax=Prauserella cavernicola TaxID=2800127 RepID=A0A934QTD5_9PSEU|nr:Nramp family divalent metal transporter [Prauserella cavernicola]MBK1786000.1 Nramp family divalent metal transporter [Prauserella cavernicola]
MTENAASGTPTEADERPPPQGWRRLRMVGPGLVMAATGIGAGDMVNGLNAGTNYGVLLLWAILLGSVLKYPLSEGIGRFYMATRKTLVAAWHDLSPVASGYFMVFFVLATFITSAGVTSAAGLAMSALFPGVMPLWAWAASHALLGFLLVWFGRYGLIERVMTVLVLVLFVTVVTLAFLTEPDVSELGSVLLPNVPDGAALGILALIGGIGGSQALAFYPYWVRDRGWNSPKWIPMMRIDLGSGYVVTGVFMVAMMFVGAGLLYGTGQDISGATGLVSLADPMAERLGVLAKQLFLVGFWAAATSTIFGVWHGSSHLFADFVRVIRKVPEEHAQRILSPSGKWFRSYLLFTTFPPMVLLVLDQPVLLVVTYSALGAVFFPFLAGTLMWFLNSRSIPDAYRNRWLGNLAIAGSGLFFVVFGVLAVLGLV